MKALKILYLLVIMASAGFGQSQKVSLAISFLFRSSLISDSNHLILGVVYRNNTERYIDVYQYLEEGYKNDHFYNINIEFEKQKAKKYVPNPVRFYKNVLLYRMEDSLSHFDLPKNKLPPFSSDTLALNLLSVSKGFVPGKYRFRAYLRVQTIQDKRAYDDKNFETSPPMDKILYLTSKWFYFTIKKEIRYNSGKQLN